jgi:aryl-alcohol dehydrogenase-like predicted oxidoreductase
MLSGFATPDGTARFRARHESSLSHDHFRSVHGLWLSSIGMGTYLGKPTSEDDAAYERSIAEALAAGCNVIDTAINYRFQRSERSIGRALAVLVAAGSIRRDEVVISTKGGFLSFDGGYPSDPGEWVVATFLRPGIIDASEIVADCHCMAPDYIEHQFEASRRNLGVDRIDIYHLHNPETQFGSVERTEVMRRLQAAFEILEGKVADGKLTLYGTATWDGYRRPPEAADHLSLHDVVEAARRAAKARGVAEHHVGAVQLPLNLAMPEALLSSTQVMPGGEDAGAPCSLLQAAGAMGLVVMGSAAILQGHLPPKIPAEMAAAIPGGESAIHKAIQWARSAPGLSTSLVGMKSPGHASENLILARSPRMTASQHRALVQARS